MFPLTVTSDGKICLFVNSSRKYDWLHMIHTLRSNLNAGLSRVKWQNTKLKNFESFNEFRSNSSMAQRILPYEIERTLEALMKIKNDHVQEQKSNAEKPSRLSVFSHYHSWDDEWNDIPRAICMN